MKIPKLDIFKRKHGKEPEQADLRPERDPLALARDDVLDRFRARRRQPVSPLAPGREEHAGLPEPGGADPAKGVGPADEVAAAYVHSEIEETERPGVTGPPAEEKASQDDANRDLLDIFREAKKDAEETSLADQVEEVAISDLLGDLVSLGHELGITPTIRRLEERRAPEVPSADEPANDRPEPQVESQRQAQMPPSPEPRPAGFEPARGRSTEPLLAPGLPADEGPTGADERQTFGGGPAREEPDGDNDAPGRRYVLHVLLVGMALSLAAGLGFRGAAGSQAFVESAYTDSLVLGYLRPPALAETITSDARESGQDPIVLFRPTPAPTPAPTPLVSPSPSPVPQAEYPSFYLYTVESGDSLTSIASEFGVCPDHVLWANPGRTVEDRLMVGDKLMIPGAVGVLHSVREGDTLDRIATRYGVSPQVILAVKGNQLEDASDLKAGSTLLVPGGVPPSALLQDWLASQATSIPSEFGYVWPFYSEVTSYYGEERSGYTHLAIDIGGLGRYGAPVVAAAAGDVVLVSYGDPAYGHYVVIRHHDATRTVYAHLAEIYVRQGQQVQRSQPLGAIGCSGASTGTHLHFEMWKDGAPVDPIPYLPDTP
jgi:LysM repeat protein